MSEHICEKNGNVFIALRVQPKASRESICMEADGRVRVTLTAPPVEGEANKALIVFLAKKLGLPKSAITIVGGLKSREKRVEIQGLGLQKVRQLMLNA